MRRTHLLFLLLIGSLALSAIFITRHELPAKPAVRHADIVIVAPHPDDAVLCCSGVIQHAIAEKRTVAVITLTNGEAYASSAAELANKPKESVTPRDILAYAGIRQTEDLAALSLLGVSQEHIFYLGYPDSALDLVDATTQKPVKSDISGMEKTYAATITDYHTLAHGSPAPYIRQSVISDLTELLQFTSPSELYVTSRGDQAPDHSVVFGLTQDAIKHAKLTAQLRTYVIHAPGWPSPDGATPNTPFADPGTVNGIWTTTSLPWPPPLRIPLTASERSIKSAAIAAYKTQETDQDFLTSFVKSEEVFWLVSPR